MRYFGGKFRIRKQIAEFLRGVRERDQVYREPFIGAVNVFCEMEGPKIGHDISLDLILLLRAVRDGVTLPDSISEEEYQELRNSPPSALRGFAGFGCSFGGKFFGGYARNMDRNYALNCKNSLLRKRPGLLGSILSHRNYRSLSPKDELIYCDPPYAGTVQPYGKKFDSYRFWETMRKWSQSNFVVISEYKAPSDFKCVLEIPTKTDMRVGTNRSKQYRIEKLFMWEGK